MLRREAQANILVTVGPATLAYPLNVVWGKKLKKDKTSCVMHRSEVFQIVHCA